MAPNGNTSSSDLQTCSYSCSKEIVPFTQKCWTSPKHFTNTPQRLCKTFQCMQRPPSSRSSIYKLAILHKAKWTVKDHMACASLPLDSCTTKYSPLPYTKYQSWAYQPNLNPPQMHPPKRIKFHQLKKTEHEPPSKVPKTSHVAKKEGMWHPKLKTALAGPLKVAGYHCLTLPTTKGWQCCPQHRPRHLSGVDPI